MKNLKIKVLSILAVMAFAVVSVVAQPPGGGPQGTPAEMAQASTDAMAERLSLTDSQKEQVSAINLKYAEKESELMSSRSSGSDPRTAMEALQEEKTSEINAVLNDTQKAEYAKLVSEMASQRGQRGGGGPR